MASSTTLIRVRVGDDTETTVYLVRHPLAGTSVRVVHFPEPRPGDPSGAACISMVVLAVCCDGRRAGIDGGLALAELARLMISFGAEEAITLDGGGSATLVHRKHLLNRPYSTQDQPAPESRPVVTAIVFEQ